MSFLKRLFGASEPEPPTRDEPTDLGDLRGQLPGSALALYAGVGGSDVVGEAHQRDAIDRVVRGPYVGGVRAIYWAQLAPEADNPYDANAVAVRINGEHVGYLSKSDAKRYRPVLEDLAAAGRQAAVRCDVWYGWNRPGAERGNYSLRLYMDSPKRQAELLAKEGLSTRTAAPVKRVQAPKPKTQSGRIKWTKSQEFLEDIGEPEYEGYIEGVRVAIVWKLGDHYGPEPWVWEVKVGPSAGAEGDCKTLRDGKAEVEKALANWQAPPKPKAPPARIKWSKDPYLADADWASGYVGEIDGILVSTIWNERGLKEWNWHTALDANWDSRYPANGMMGNSHEPTTTLRDAKVEVERALANWQP